MAIKIACPNPDCKAEYHVPQERLGHSAKCSRCGLKFTLQMSADETGAADGKAPISPLPSGEGQGAPKHSPKKTGWLGQSAAVPQSTRAELPTKIGHYQIKRLLGSGAMGHVYLAHDPHLDRDVALKVLPRELTADEERVSRFLREARLTAKIQHPNTVVIHQVMVEDGLASIVMELLDGGSLDDIVEKRGPMPWREATQAIRDAAAGLGAAHKLGLVHRDVKPANLMRTGEGTVKVVDFGLVRAMHSTSQLTQMGTILGTPTYMAPEQWTSQEADARSDLYSLVCTYYFLLTGKAPYAADSVAALGYQHRHEPFPDARKLVSDLPPAACRILAHGTEKEPDERFQTAAELIAALDELLAMKVTELEYEELLEPEILETPVITDLPAHSPGDAPGECVLPAIPPAAPVGSTVAPGFVRVGDRYYPRHASPTGTDTDWTNLPPVPGEGLLRGFAAAVRGFDWFLRRIVGEENDILRYFLWAVFLLLLLGAVWAGISALTPSPAWHDVAGVSKPKASVAQPLAADTGKEVAKDSADKLATPGKEPLNWIRAQIPMVVGNVEVMVLRPTRGAPPPGATTTGTDVLTVPVRLNLTPGQTKSVELKSWADRSFRKTVLLKDDHNKTYDLLEQAAEKGNDGKTITENWMKVYLVFDVPTGKEPKFFHLTLPAAAFQADGPLIGFEIDLSDIRITVTQPPPPLPKQTAFDLDNGAKLEMVLIPAGAFTMGSADSDQADEKPQHQVRITKPFYMGKYLVTQEQWEAVMGNNPSNFKGAKNPVECVSWDDCQQFLEKLNAKIGRQGGKFVLPTEAQWEYACRGGSTSKYCFGDDEARLGEYAWYSDNSERKTHPVGGKKPNAWGLYDMHGNVWEWCQDWYDDGYYAKSATDDPAGPVTGSDRVGRGGCWDFDAGYCRSANRDCGGPGIRSSALGFRASRVSADMSALPAQPIRP